MPTMRRRAVNSACSIDTEGKEAVDEDSKQANRSSTVVSHPEVSETLSRQTILSTFCQWNNDCMRKGWPYDIFYADLRSLAVLRIGLGLVMLLDLFNRWQEIDVWYTDDGLTPRAEYIRDHIQRDGFVAIPHIHHDNAPESLYHMSGHGIQIRMLFLLHSMLAVFYVFGYSMKTTSVVGWFAHRSLHSRCSLISNKGDELFIRMLMWAMFVPLGARWSIDSWTDLKKGQTKYRSLGTFGLYLQCILLYWVTGYFKTAQDWMEGYAGHATLLLNQYACDNMFTRLLRANPMLCYVSTYATLFGEKYGVFGVLGPPRMRAIVIILLTLMQTAFFLSLMVGIFPFVSTCVVIPLLPSEIWSKGSAPILTFLERYSSLLAETFCELLEIRIKKVSTSNPSERSRSKSWIWIKRAKCTLFNVLYFSVLSSMLASSTVFALTTTSVLHGYPWVSNKLWLVSISLGQTQPWGMFSPGVQTADTQYFLPGVLADGSEVDAWNIIRQDSQQMDHQVFLNQTAFSDALYKYQPFADQKWPSSFWISYLARIVEADDENICDGKSSRESFRCEKFSSYVCRRWNEKFSKNPDKELIAFRIVAQLQRTVKGNCTGCAAELPLEHITRWVSGCKSNLRKPPSGIYPPKLSDIQ